MLCLGLQSPSSRIAHARTSPFDERQSVLMAICADCKTEETDLYENGVPICLKCEQKRKAKSSDVRTVLVSGIVEATARVSAASEAFSKVMGQVPTGLPHLMTLSVFATPQANWMPPVKR